MKIYKGERQNKLLTLVQCQMSWVDQCGAVTCSTACSAPGNMLEWVKAGSPVVSLVFKQKYTETLEREIKVRISDFVYEVKSFTTSTKVC